MTDRPADNVAHLGAPFAERRDDDRCDDVMAVDARYIDRLSIALLGFWHGVVWPPLPVDTRDAWRRRHKR